MTACVQQVRIDHNDPNDGGNHAERLFSRFELLLDVKVILLLPIVLINHPAEAVIPIHKVQLVKLNGVLYKSFIAGAA